MGMPFQDFMYTDFVVHLGKAQQRMSVIGEFLIEVIDQPQGAWIALGAAQDTMANGHGRVVRVKPAVPPSAQSLLTRLESHSRHCSQHLPTGKGCRPAVVATPQAGCCGCIHMPWRHRTRSHYLAGKRTDIARVMIGHVVEQSVQNAQLTLTVYAADIST